MDYEFQKVFTEPEDWMVKELHKMYRNYLRNRGGKRLDIRPDFQRRQVWDREKSSRLIESVIMGYPLPAIYVAKEPDGLLSVIDGQQRLTALFHFMGGDLYPDSKFFGNGVPKLSGLTVLPELNNKTYDELVPDHQEMISECDLRVIVFQEGSERGSKFDLFSRLNLGSVKLNHQEMRNCVYRGSYNDLLLKLSEHSGFQKIMGYSAPHKRMKDVQYVLQFAAFHFKNYVTYNSSMKKFLDDEMERRQDIPKQSAQKLKAAFNRAVDSVLAVFGEKAFRRWLIDPNTHQFRRDDGIVDALYQILMWSFARQDRDAIMQNADAIREALIYRSTASDRFVRAVIGGTNSDNVESRFEIWKRTLDEILSCQDKQPRCFSRQLKEELYDANQTCAMCKQHIADIDDSVIADNDGQFIEDYWLGRTNIPEDARLVHRHCNKTRTISAE